MISRKMLMILVVFSIINLTKSWTMMGYYPSCPEHSGYKCKRHTCEGQTVYNGNCGASSWLSKYKQAECCDYRAKATCKEAGKGDTFMSALSCPSGLTNTNSSILIYSRKEVERYTWKTKWASFKKEIKSQFKIKCCAPTDNKILKCKEAPSCGKYWNVGWRKAKKLEFGGPKKWTAYNTCCYSRAKRDYTPAKLSPWKTCSIGALSMKLSESYRQKIMDAYYDCLQYKYSSQTCCVYVKSFAKFPMEKNKMQKKEMKELKQKVHDLQIELLGKNTVINEMQTEVFKAKEESEHWQAKLATETSEEVNALQEQLLKLREQLGNQEGKEEVPKN